MLNLAAVSLSVKHPGAVPVLGAILAMIGEPEAPAAIKHEIVGSAERATIASIIKNGERPRSEIEAFDATTAVVDGLVPGIQPTIALMPLEAAVIADVERTIGAERRSVGPPARGSHDALRAIETHLRDRSTGDLYQQHPPIGEGHRALGKAKALRHKGAFPPIHLCFHESSPPKNSAP